MVSIMGNLDWIGSSEHLVNTRGPLVFVGDYNASVCQDPLQLLRSPLNFAMGVGIDPLISP